MAKAKPKTKGRRVLGSVADVKVWREGAGYRAGWIDAAGQRRRKRIDTIHDETKPTESDDAAILEVAELAGVPPAAVRRTDGPKG